MFSAPVLEDLKNQIAYMYGMGYALPESLNRKIEAQMAYKQERWAAGEDLSYDMRAEFDEQLSDFSEAIEVADDMVKGLVNSGTMVVERTQINHDQHGGGVQFFVAIYGEQADFKAVIEYSFAGKFIACTEVKAAYNFFDRPWDIAPAAPAEPVDNP